MLVYTPLCVRRGGVAEGEKKGDVAVDGGERERKKRWCGGNQSSL